MADVIKIWSESAQIEWLENPNIRISGISVQVEYVVGSSISTASTSSQPGLFFCHA